MNRRDTLKLAAGVLASSLMLQAQGVGRSSQKMVLPRNRVHFNKSGLALLVVNPQNDYLSPDGVGWGLYGASIKEQDTVKNIGMLLDAAKYIGLHVIVSHQRFRKQDHVYMPNSPFFNFVKGANMLEDGSKGAEFLSEYRQFIDDPRTVVLSPSKRVGLMDNNLKLELSSRSIRQVVLCGMDAEVNVSTYLRELISLSLSVTVVADATAGANIPEGNSYESAMVGFRYIASDVITTQEFMKRIQ